MGSHEILLLLTCKSLCLPAPIRDLPGASPRGIRRGGWQRSSRQLLGFRRSVSPNELRSICRRPNPWLDPYSAEAGPIEHTKTFCFGAHLYEIESGFLRSVRRRIRANSAKTMQPHASSKNAKCDRCASPTQVRNSESWFCNCSTGWFRESEISDLPVSNCSFLDFLSLDGTSRGSLSIGDLVQRPDQNVVR